MLYANSALHGQLPVVLAIELALAIVLSRKPLAAGNILDTIG